MNYLCLYVEDNSACPFTLNINGERGRRERGERMVSSSQETENMV
jgi:hypothetical protein